MEKAERVHSCRAVHVTARTSDTQVDASEGLGMAVQSAEMRVGK